MDSDSITLAKNPPTESIPKPFPIDCRPSHFLEIYHNIPKSMISVDRATLGIHPNFINIFPKNYAQTFKQLWQLVSRFIPILVQQSISKHSKTFQHSSNNHSQFIDNSTHILLTSLGNPSTSIQIYPKGIHKSIF